MAGTLDQKMLDKLLPAAATAAMADEYRAGLARNSEHHLVGAFHRALKADAADAVLDSLRPKFDAHAAAIAEAKRLGINSESNAEHIISTGEDGLVTAWRELGGHLQAVAAIGMVAKEFGPSPVAQFGQVVEYAQGENFRLVDAAVMCGDGPLADDSSPFQRPDQGHKSSPWFKIRLKLHTIESARARYAEWAAGEHDRLHSGPRGGYIGEDGRMIEDPKPKNPFREEVDA